MEIEFHDGKFYEIKHNRIEFDRGIIKFLIDYGDDRKEIPYYVIKLIWRDSVFALFDNDQYRKFQNGIEIGGTINE